MGDMRSCVGALLATVMPRLANAVPITLALHLRFAAFACRRRANVVDLARTGRLDEAALAGQIGRLGAVCGMQFHQDIRDIVLDGAFGQYKLLSDLAIAPALRQ